MANVKQKNIASREMQYKFLENCTPFGKSSLLGSTVGII